MQQHTGRVLIAIGALHTAVGLREYREQLAAIGRDGVVDAVLPHQDRQTAVWFGLTGVVLLLWGASIHWAQRKTGRLPPALHWQLLGIGSLGIVLMPRSGFWSLLPAALLAWMGRREPVPTPKLR